MSFGRAIRAPSVDAGARGPDRPALAAGARLREPARSRDGDDIIARIAGRAGASGAATRPGLPAVSPDRLPAPALAGHHHRPAAAKARDPPGLPTVLSTSPAPPSRPIARGWRRPRGPAPPRALPPRRIGSTADALSAPAGRRLPHPDRGSGITDRRGQPYQGGPNDSLAGGNRVRDGDGVAGRAGGGPASDEVRAGVVRRLLVAGIRRRHRQGGEQGRRELRQVRADEEEYGWQGHVGPDPGKQITFQPDGQGKLVGGTMQSKKLTPIPRMVVPKKK